MNSLVTIEEYDKSYQAQVAVLALGARKKNGRKAGGLIPGSVFYLGWVHFAFRG